MLPLREWQSWETVQVSMALPLYYFHVRWSAIFFLKNGYFMLLGWVWTFLLEGRQRETSGCRRSPPAHWATSRGGYPLCLLCNTARLDIWARFWTESAVQGGQVDYRVGQFDQGEPMERTRATTSAAASHDHLKAPFFRLLHIIIARNPPRLGGRRWVLWQKWAFVLTLEFYECA